MKMQKKLIFAFVIVMSSVAMTFLNNITSEKEKTLVIESCEALSGCEVLKDKELIFRCDGTKETCSMSFKEGGVKGTISCSGKLAFMAE